MSKTYISGALRKAVSERAKDACEYCLIPIQFANAQPYHIDHVISEKHRGKTELSNLALACPGCNIAKGSDVASVIHGSTIVVPLYHPRKDRWQAHFYLDENGEIIGKSETGLVTIDLLSLNEEENCSLRRVLLLSGLDIIP